jgi:hypothetical protein
MKKIILISFLIFCVNFLSNAQDKTEYADQTFHSNHVINGQSVDLIPAGVLDFNLSHRMGRINGGFDNFFGIDQATSRLGLDYGFTDWLMAGIGRSTTDKLVDGSIKIKILRQSSGERNMPFSLTYFSSMAINTLPWTAADTLEKHSFSNKLYYTNQLIIARKFSNSFSLQLSPTLVHRNIVATRRDKNDVFAIGLAGKLKLSNRIDLTAEYFYVLPHQIRSQYNSSDVVNSASIGIDIYTGKHTFQVFITNSTTMADKAFITESTERWDKGYIHIGFNLLRLFTIVNK